MPVKRSCHWLELEVGRPGALLRFQYVLPSDAHALEGVAALAAGTLPGDYARRGLLAGGPHRAREAFYPVCEALDAGRMLNGNYLDGHAADGAFSPYRLKIVFKTLNR